MTIDQFHMEPVRTILSNEVNNIEIFRSVEEEGLFFTLVLIKDRKTIEKALKLLSKTTGIGSDDSDLLKVSTIKNQLVLTFRYFPERRFRSFFSMTAMDIHCVHQAAKTFIEKCMGSELPYELLWLAIQENNISIDKSHTIYFNYFLDLKRFPDYVTKKQLAERAAYFIKEIYIDYYHKKSRGKRLKFPRGVELFIRKQENGNFVSFSDVYEDILFLIKDEADKEKEKSSFWDRIKMKTGINNEFIKAFVVTIIVLITSIYVYSECRVRSIPAFLYNEKPENTVYNGVDIIGKEDLTDGEKTGRRSD